MKDFVWFILLSIGMMMSGHYYTFSKTVGITPQALKRARLAQKVRKTGKASRSYAWIPSKSVIRK